jgi:hypothetical protein
MFTKSERSSFPYWFAHWAAFQMTALNCRAWKFKYLFHDFEKPWLRIFLPYPKVQKIHRAYNKHHPEWLERQLFCMPPNYEWLIEKCLDKFDYDAAIIDWECCHFTKAEEPLDAHDEYKRLLNHDNFSKKYPWITKLCYNEFSHRLMDSIKKLGLENEY